MHPPFKGKYTSIFTTMKYYLIFILCCIIVTKNCRAQVNTAAIEAYWRVTEILKKDKQPSREIWDSFFAEKGNYVIIKNITNRNKYIDTTIDLLQLAYMLVRERFWRNP